MSQPTEIKIVDLADGSNYSLTGIGQLTGSDMATEIGRYTIDGRRASKDYKGIVIIKMSDGSAIKTLAK